MYTTGTPLYTRFLSVNFFLAVGINLLRSSCLKHLDLWCAKSPVSPFGHFGCPNCVRHGVLTFPESVHFSGFSGPSFLDCRWGVLNPGRHRTHRLSSVPRLPTPHPRHSSLKHSLCCVWLTLLTIQGIYLAEARSFYMSILTILIPTCNFDNPPPPGISVITPSSVIKLLICLPAPFPFSSISAKQAQIYFVLFQWGIQRSFCSSLLSWESFRT